MSLILEALKKSEQQRRLGEMPTLGTPAPTSRRRRSLLPVLAGLIVVALGAGWWFMRTPHTAPPTDEAKPAAVAVDPTAATPPAAPPRAARTEPKAPAARAGAPPPATAPVVVPMPTTDRPGAVRPAPNAALVGTPAAPAKPATPPASTATATAPAGKPAAPKAGAETRPAAPMKPGVGDKATASQPNPTPRDAKVPAPDTKAPAPAPEARTTADAKADARPATTKPATPALPSVWELPYGTRKELPDLKLTMHVYSNVPAERFIVIEGARHVEGDDLGNGVVLHEISTDGMVLDFKGQRFLYPRDGR